MAFVRCGPGRAAATIASWITSGSVAPARPPGVTADRSRFSPRAA